MMMPRADDLSSGPPMSSSSSSTALSSPSPSPPYATSSSSSSYPSAPYEGERSLAALLHMDELVPRILSFLTPVELMFVQSVCRSWYMHVRTARQSLIPRLHLGQFWSRIGVLPTEYFTNLAQQFGNVTELNCGYCNFMSGPTFFQILTAVPRYERLTKINLYYCYNLTDDDIDKLLHEYHLPNLRELNIGRCPKLSDRSVRLLAAECPNLQYLNLVHNPNVGEETFMLFDDLTKFPSLTLLNLMHASRIRMDEVEELIRSCSSNGRNANLVKRGLTPLRVLGPQELFQIDKTGKKMRKDIDADL